MNRHSSKAGLFLMELIIAILVFSIAGAVCVRMFAKAYTLSIRSKELSHAVTIVQSQAEIFYGNPGSVTDADIFYDKDFEVCNEDAAVYEMTSEVSKGGGKAAGMNKYDIHVMKINGEEIYSLCVENVKDSGKTTSD